MQLETQQTTTEQYEFNRVQSLLLRLEILIHKTLAKLTNTRDLCVGIKTVQ